MAGVWGWGLVSSGPSAPRLSRDLSALPRPHPPARVVTCAYRINTRPPASANHDRQPRVASRGSATAQRPNLTPSGRAPHPVDVQFISVVSSRDAAVVKEVILTASLVWLQLGSWLHRPRALEIGNADAAIADSLTLPPPCLSAPSSYYHQLLPNDLVGHARTDSSLLRRCARSVQNSLTARIPSSPPVQFYTWDPLPTDPGRSTQILRSLSSSPAYYHARSIYNLPPEAYLTPLEVCPRYPSGVPPFPNTRWSAQGP